LQGWGSDDEDEEDELFELQEDNQETLRVFITMWTQWHAVGGMNGLIYTGMNYQSLPEVWERLGVKKKRRNEIFAELRMLEAELLLIKNKPKTT
jgi:hypothetical protein